MERKTETGEQEIAARCAKGDKDAMEELYMQYAARLSALCSRYSGGPSEGMDLMHDTMVRVFDRIGRFQYRGDGSLYAWISSLAIHLAVDRLRMEKKLEITFFDDNDLPEMAEPEPADIQRIPVSVLNGMIASLPPSKRLVFNMFCIDGIPHKEIAHRLGITERTSTSILAKAKKRLAGMINIYLAKET